MVVVNITNKDLKIPEIRSIVPADGKKYIVPYDVAINYKWALSPVQMSDQPMWERPSDEPLNRQIQEMNANAVANLKQLNEEYKRSIYSTVDDFNKDVPEVNNVYEELTIDVDIEPESNDDSWDALSKYEKIKTIYINNPKLSAVKIAEYAGVSYTYAVKSVRKIKRELEDA